MSYRDWRGVDITPGATVIYGAGIGRSIALVEARVTLDEVIATASGKIRLEVIRRAYGGWSEHGLSVKVGPDRLTIVDSLASSSLPTEHEKYLVREARVRALMRGET